VVIRGSSGSPPHPPPVTFLSTQSSFSQSNLLRASGHLRVQFHLASFRKVIWRSYFNQPDRGVSPPLFFLRDMTSLVGPQVTQVLKPGSFCGPSNFSMALLSSFRSSNISLSTASFKEPPPSALLVPFGVSPFLDSRVCHRLPCFSCPPF